MNFINCKVCFVGLSWYEKANTVKFVGVGVGGGGGGVGEDSNNIYSIS